MIKAWTDDAWNDFEYWTRQGRKPLKRILTLLKDIDRNGYEGIGKPEQLSGDLSQYWSRRIDDCNGLFTVLTEMHSSLSVLSFPACQPRDGETGEQAILK
ncbi:MAG: Txe/YoeB family addiction module toxin [Sphaerochaeta sp.]|nr:Txe/YoeB family addiction module toxin [Sphaerochaeta sp.]